MTYQACRWYDPYPRLAFAMKMLALSPKPLQDGASRMLQLFFAEQWDGQQAEKRLGELKYLNTGKRWYDRDLASTQAVELLKRSPEILKTLAADRVLDFLVQEPDATPERVAS